MRIMHFALFIAMCVVIGLLIGCEKPETTTPSAQGTSATKPATPAPKTPLVTVPQIADWCKEHGVPESICTRCNDSLVAQFKEKGDWCKKHNLPDSQCFDCHPELQQKFAADFKAKYGKEPPPITP